MLIKDNNVEIELEYEDGFPIININLNGFTSDKDRPTVEICVNGNVIHEMFEKSEYDEIKVTDKIQLLVNQQDLEDDDRLLIRKIADVLQGDAMTISKIAKEINHPVFKTLQFVKAMFDEGLIEIVS